MIVEIERYIGILNKLKITANQFLFLYLIHEHLYNDIHTYGKGGRGFKQEEIDDLIDRELITDFNKVGNRFADCYVVDDKFVDLVFNVDVSKNGMELWNAYPAQISVELKQHAGRNMDQDLFLTQYYTLVGHSEKKHKEVMGALAYAKQKNMIQSGLKSWFASRQWETILQQMKTNAAPTKLPSQRLFQSGD